MINNNYLNVLYCLNNYAMYNGTFKYNNNNLIIIIYNNIFIIYIILN